jgi:glycosyltransferase involved in cell wall biosynthesis
MTGSDATPARIFPLPTISIVTPSYNQVSFLEATIQSILSQKYPALEYIVMDGGSTDGSVDVICRYESELAHWESQKDRGQYDAINRGFARSSGEIMGWLNSDDMHMPWTLEIVGEIFASFPEIEWLTTMYPLEWDSSGRVVQGSYRPGFSRKAFLRGENLADWIQQESTFWRRSLWDRAGGHLDTRVSLAADFELWARFFRVAELWTARTPLAGFRMHPEQKTTQLYDKYVREAREVLRGYGGKEPNRVLRYARSRTRSLLPTRFRHAAASLGILDERRVCTYSRTSSSWTMEDV